MELEAPLKRLYGGGYSDTIETMAFFYGNTSPLKICSNRNFVTQFSRLNSLPIGK